MVVARGCQGSWAVLGVLVPFRVAFCLFVVRFLPCRCLHSARPSLPERLRDRSTALLIAFLIQQHHDHHPNGQLDAVSLITFLIRQHPDHHLPNGFVLTLLGISGGISKKRSPKRKDCGNITVDCFLTHPKGIQHQ